VLAPFARRKGLRGCYSEYLSDTGETVEEIEALSPEIAALIPGL
jgi:hypothetical protein